MTVQDVLSKIPEEVRPKALSVIHDVNRCVDQHCTSLAPEHEITILHAVAEWARSEAGTKAKILENKLKNPIPVDMSAKMTAHSSIKG